MFPGTRITWRLPYVVTKKAKWTVACCPVLDLFAQGGDEKEAKRNLVDMIQLFIESCYERNTLDEALKECGFKVFHKEDTPMGVAPLKIEPNYLNVQLPLSVVKSATRCRA